MWLDLHHDFWNEYVQKMTPHVFGFCGHVFEKIHSCLQLKDANPTAGSSLASPNVGAIASRNRSWFNKRSKTCIIQTHSENHDSKTNKQTSKTSIQNHSKQSWFIRKTLICLNMQNRSALPNKCQILPLGLRHFGATAVHHHLETLPIIPDPTGWKNNWMGTQSFNLSDFYTDLHVDIFMMWVHQFACKNQIHALWNVFRLLVKQTCWRL